MKHKLSPEKRSERIAEIVAEITSITEFAEGSISSAENKYRTKDGTVMNAKKRWRFQTKRARGKQKHKHVPTAAVSRVKQLIANGKRYRKLEAEYSRLVTEEALEGLKKTADA